MTKNPKSARNHPKYASGFVVLAISIALIAILMGTTTWSIHSQAISNQQKTMNVAVAQQQVANTPVSPLLFGTNMGLFDSNDQVLNSATTRAALQQIHMRIIRMPIRSSLSEATEIQAAQAIKSMGAIPLVILRGQPDKNVLADDRRIVQDMNTIFGQSIVYYEYGNEEDLLGVSVAQYTASWNAVVPQLKSIALHANFVGPVNFQYDHKYLAAFLQSAQPRPDEVSWHEYTCDDSWAASICISHIDHWTNHITDARATMISTIGTELPIMITEWNYAPNAVPNDGKNNNSAFMDTWTAHALQTLAANRIFASMQYSCTNTAIPLITGNGTITTQGNTFQAQYQSIVLNGNPPTPPTPATPQPTPTTPQPTPATPQSTPTTPQSTPTPGTSPSDITTKGFTFADGGTDGWSAHSSILTLQNSAAPGLNGKALHITIGAVDNEDYPSIFVNASKLSSSPQAGQTLHASVYIANNSVSTMAKVFVADGNYQWHYSSMTALTPGTWVHLTYTLPGNFQGPPKQIGIQFNSPNGSTISNDVYVNSVTWS